jgi:drug/metabolite transporter (DMT)-like permease
VGWLVEIAKEAVRQLIAFCVTRPYRVAQRRVARRGGLVYCPSCGSADLQRDVDPVYAGVMGVGTTFAYVFGLASLGCLVLFVAAFIEHKPGGGWESTWNLFYYAVVALGGVVATYLTWLLLVRFQSRLAPRRCRACGHDAFASAT